MATLEQLQRLALRTNAATFRYDVPSPAPSVIEEGRGIVREAKAAGLACKRIVAGSKSGYDCIDPTTKALLQVRVERLEAGQAKLVAAVHGIDRARRGESPLAKAKRERDDAMRDLDACRRSCGTSTQRTLFT